MTKADERNADWIKWRSREADLAATDAALQEEQPKSRRQAAMNVIRISSGIMATQTFKAKSPKQRAADRIRAEMAAAQAIYRKATRRQKSIEGQITRLKLEAASKEFDPDQPRDEGGRFSSTGGGASGREEVRASDIGLDSSYGDMSITDRLAEDSDFSAVIGPEGSFYSIDGDMQHAQMLTAMGEDPENFSSDNEQDEAIEDALSKMTLGGWVRGGRSGDFLYMDPPKEREFTKDQLTIAQQLLDYGRGQGMEVNIGDAQDDADLRRMGLKLKQLSGSGNPGPLRYIIDEAMAELSDLTNQLQLGQITAAEWEDEFERVLARYHTAGLMTGLDREVLKPQEVGYVARLVGSQFEYLDNFAIDIQDAEEWAEGFATRAESYALAIKQPYWAGDTQLLPLPAMPAEGTQCLNNCGCEWEIQQLEGDGNFDCFWRRNKDDSCQTCLEREEQWSPVEIRGWELM